MREEEEEEEQEEEELEEEDEANDDGRMDDATIPTIFHDRTLLSQLNANLDVAIVRRRRIGPIVVDRTVAGTAGTAGNDHRDDDPLLSLFDVDDIPQISCHTGR